MADNVTANSIPVATRSITYSGDAGQNAQVIGLVTFSGSDDAKTATDVPFPTSLGAQGGFKIEGVASGTPVPVSGPLTDTELRAADVKITLDGESVPVTGPLTDMELRATPVPVSGTFYQATQPVSATDLDIRDLTATDVVTVTGGAGQTADVKVTLDSESVAVTGTFWQATQPVSGPLTDTELRATPIPVSGTVAVTTLKPDGTNTMPSLDTAARRGYVQVTDGTNSPAIRTAWTDSEPNSLNSMEICAHHMIYNGATWDRARGDITNGLDVDVTRVSGTVTVSATDLDIRNLSQAQDSVAIGDGTDTVAVSTAAADGESNTVNRLEVEGYNMVFNGTTWDRLRGSTTGGSWVQGPAATGATIAGNPVMVGGRASSAGNPSDVTAGQMIQARMDLHGCMFVQVHESLPTGSNTIGATTTPEALADDAAFTVATSKVFPAGFLADMTSPDSVDEGDTGIARMTLDRRQLVELGNGAGAAATASSTGTGDTALVAAQGSGVSIYVTGVCGYNASTTDSWMYLKDGSTNKLPIPMAAKGGFTWTLANPLKITANTALNFAAQVGVSTAYVGVTYFTAPG